MRPLAAANRNERTRAAHTYRRLVGVADATKRRVVVCELVELVVLLVEIVDRCEKSREYAESFECMITTNAPFDPE